MTTSANGGRGQRIAQVGRVGQGRNAAVATTVDPASEPGWLLIRRRLQIGAFDPDRRRADEPLARGSGVRVDLANRDRPGVKAGLGHLLAQHGQRPLPGGTISPPEEFYFLMSRRPP